MDHLQRNRFSNGASTDNRRTLRSHAIEQSEAPASQSLHPLHQNYIQANADEPSFIETFRKPDLQQSPFAIKAALSPIGQRGFATAQEQAPNDNPLGEVVSTPIDTAKARRQESYFQSLVKSPTSIQTMSGIAEQLPPGVNPYNSLQPLPAFPYHGSLPFSDLHAGAAFNGLMPEGAPRTNSTAYKEQNKPRSLLTTPPDGLPAMKQLKVGSFAYNNEPILKNNAQNLGRR